MRRRPGIAWPACFVARLPCRWSPHSRSAARIRNRHSRASRRERNAPCACDVGCRFRASDRSRRKPSCLVAPARAPARYRCLRLRCRTKRACRVLAHAHCTARAVRSEDNRVLPANACMHLLSSCSPRMKCPRHAACAHPMACFLQNARRRCRTRAAIALPTSINRGARPCTYSLVIGMPQHGALIESGRVPRPRGSSCSLHYARWVHQVRLTRAQR